jgi:hypothetical protein
MNQVASVAILSDIQLEERWEAVLSAELSQSSRPVLKMLIFVVSIRGQNIFNSCTSYAGISSTLLTNIMPFAK